MLFSLVITLNMVERFLNDNELTGRIVASISNLSFLRYLFVDLVLLLVFECVASFVNYVSMPRFMCIHGLNFELVCFIE